jgi:bacterioferritin (cytochrome b1)
VQGGHDCKDLLAWDRQLEARTLPPLTQGGSRCWEQGEAGTRERLAPLSVAGKEHLEWLERQLPRMHIIGLEP